MRRVSLIHMRENQKGRVLEIAGGSLLQNRMMSMGIYPGKEVKKLSHFVLRGPITIKIGRTVLALGHGMASKVFLEIE